MRTREIADANIHDALAKQVRVAGVRRIVVRRNNVDTPCDSCQEPVPAGGRFIRVLYADDRGREHFHIPCFRWEFTND